MIIGINANNSERIFIFPFPESRNAVTLQLRKAPIEARKSNFLIVRHTDGPMEQPNNQQTGRRSHREATLPIPVG